MKTNKINITHLEPQDQIDMIRSRLSLDNPKTIEEAFDIVRQYETSSAASSLFRSKYGNNGELLPSETLQNLMNS